MVPAVSSCPEDYGKAVCVMDASGYLGSRLAERLLQKGYTVHAAVNNGGESNFLKNLAADYSKKMKMFTCDPLDYQSIIDATKGCNGLFYNFEPPRDHSTYDEFIVEVEVRAAHNVLEACAQTDTIEKVVFTSSVTALIWKENRKSVTEFDERSWSEASFCRNFKLWFALSKTLAEKTAWALAMDRGVSMVSINAGLLMSPDLIVTHPYLKGAAEMYEDGVFVMVDVNYLVDTHICVFEKTCTYGRYITFNQLINREEDAIKLARLMSPAATYPPKSDNTKIYEQRISNKKLNKFMVEFAAEEKEQQV